MTNKMICPRRSKGMREDDPQWVTVDTWLNHRALVDLGNPGHPVPDGCTGEWRAFIVDNNYGDEVVVLQAKLRDVKRFQVQNTSSGIILGVYEAATEADALEMMARDAGYGSYAEACAGAPCRDGELIVKAIIG